MSGSKQERFNHADDIDAIYHLEDQAQTALSGDDVMRHIAREVVMADIMTGGSPSAWYVGWEQQWANMHAQFAHVRDLTAEMQDMTYVSNGRLACLGMYVHAITQQGKVPITFRELDAFRKTKGGSWLLTMSHVYYPVDRETSRFDRNWEVPLRGPVQWSGNPLPGPAVSEEQALHELRDWFDSRIVAATAEEVMRHFAADEEVIAFGPYLPGVHRGRNEVRAHYAEMLKNVRRVTSEVTDYHVQTDGELGMIISRQNLSLSLTDGKAEQLSIRHSGCLRRNGSRWEAMMEMISFPVDLATGLAITEISSRPHASMSECSPPGASSD